MSSLIEAFQQIPEYRKARGKRHPLWVLLLLVVMGMLAGYDGYRPLQAFAQEHQGALCQLLGWEEKVVPSYSTFRRMMMALDFHELSDCVERWMLSQGDGQSLGLGFSAAMDGKRIAQAVHSADGKERFVGLVSLFAAEQGVTLKLAALSEQDNSEIPVVQTLLETLKLDGLLLSMDALHAQKKH
jgi:hypothetical protein